MNGGIHIWHRSASPIGHHKLDITETLSMAATANFAKLVQNHYWPYLTPKQEYQRCLPSQQALGRIIWGTINGHQHHQVLRNRAVEREHDTTDLTLHLHNAANNHELIRQQAGVRMATPSTLPRSNARHHPRKNSNYVPTC